MKTCSRTGRPDCRRPWHCAVGRHPRRRYVASHLPDVDKQVEQVEQVEKFFTDCGYDVVTAKGLKCKSPMLIAHESEKTLRDAIIEVNDPSVEAIVQAGTNLAMARVGAMAKEV